MKSALLARRIEVLLSGHAPALAEAKILHPGKSGYFVLCGRVPGTLSGWRQTALPMHALESAIDAVKQLPCDRYITQASYIAPSRKAINFQSIRTAFVDIDCLQKLGITPNPRFVQHVLETTEMLGIPKPSAVIFSGRGLYCKWYFSNAVSATEMIRWKTLNSALLKMYVSLGADTKVRDLSRVLRVIGSTNSKVGAGQDEVVRVAYDSGHLHDFDGLCASVAQALANFHQIANPHSNIQGLIQGDVSTKVNASTRAVLNCVAELNERHTNLAGLQSYSDIRRPLLLADSVGAALTTSKEGVGTSAYERDVGLNWRRFIDLRNLIMMRGGAPKGTRDQYVFWMLNHLALAGVVTPDNFVEEARDLIHLFPQADGFDPLSEGHLNTLAQRIKLAASGSTVEFGGRPLGHLYTPKTAELVDCFEISPEEQKQMCTLFLAPEKQRRRDEKNPGRAERRAERAERIQIIRSLPDVASTVVADVVPLSDRQIRRLRQRAAIAAAAHEHLARGMSIGEIASDLKLTIRQVKLLLKSPEATPAMEGANTKSTAGPRGRSKALCAQEMKSRGLCPSTIADQMGISERHVRRLLASAPDKLEMQNLDGAEADEPHPPLLDPDLSPPNPLGVERSQNAGPLRFFWPERAETMATEMDGETSLGKGLPQPLDPARSEQGGGQLSRTCLNSLEKNVNKEFESNHSEKSPRRTDAIARHERLLKKAEDAKQRMNRSEQRQGPVVGSSTLEEDAPAVSTMQEAPAEIMSASGHDDPFEDSLFEGYESDGSNAQAAAIEPPGDSQMMPPSPPPSLPLSPLRTRPAFDVTPPRVRQASFQATGRSDGRELPSRALDSAAQPPPLPRGNRPIFNAPPMRVTASKGGDASPSEDPPWDDDHRPAGSRYSPQEWADARGENGEFHVIEFVARRESALIRLDATPATRAVVHKNKETGQTTSTRIWQSNTPMHNLYGVVAECFDGCMILGPGGKTDHPGRERRNAITVTDPLRDAGMSPRPGRDMSYSIIEPVVMVNEYGRGAALKLDAGPLFYELLPVPQDEDADEGGCQTNAFERPRP